MGVFFLKKSIFLSEAEMAINLYFIIFFSVTMCEMSLFWRMFTSFNHFFYKAFLKISYQSALIQEKPPVQVGISLKKALIFYDLIGVLCLFQLLTVRITSKLTPKKSHIGSSCKILVPEALEVLSLECLDSMSTMQRQQLMLK